MPLPFHWLFRRETWNRELYSPDKFLAVLGKLETHGMTQTEVKRVFFHFFGFKLRLVNGRPNFSPKNQISLEKEFGDFQERILSFIRQQTTGADAFIEHESPRARVRRMEREERQKEADAGRERAFERRMAKEFPRLELKPHEPKPGSTAANGAARGFYMGQMLNQQRQTNEHLEKLRNLLGG